jgi:UDP-N-acetylglucosamine 2-epimerase (non-hydrolysing)
VVNTGQHQGLLSPVLDRFDLVPDYTLAVMEPGQQLADLTAKLLQQVDGVLAHQQPAFALVQCDTTTALAAAQDCFYRHVPIGTCRSGIAHRRSSCPLP